MSASKYSKILIFLFLSSSNLWSMGKPKVGNSSSATTSSSSSSLSSQASSSSSTSSEGDFSYVDPQHLIPSRPLQIALAYYKANKNNIENINYLTVVDFTQYANNKRFYLIDMRSGQVEQFLVAHGSGSDPSHTGFANFFSNLDGTHATALGFYKTGATYTGGHGYSLYLDGLSSTNSNARAREIVVHGASYVDPSYNPLGRSWGCLALEMSERSYVISKIQSGSIIYAYHSKFSKEQWSMRTFNCCG